MNKFFFRGIFIVLCAVLSFSCSSDDDDYDFNSSNSSSKYVLIDSDTGADIDGYFAINALLQNDSKYEIEGITSSQFNNIAWFREHQDIATNYSFSTAEYSNKENDTILNYNNGNNILTPYVGCQDKLDLVPTKASIEESNAVSAIRHAVNSLPKGDKLDIICLGSATNLASALILEPTLASDIRVWIIACNSIDTNTGVWDKNEFNVLNDPTAFDLLLENSNLELHIISRSVASQFKMQRSWIDSNNTILDDYLLKKWNGFGYGIEKNSTAAVPDLALVKCYLDYVSGEKSKIYKESAVKVPSENGSRKVNVIDYVNSEQLEFEIWKLYNY